MYHWVIKMMLRQAFEDVSQGKFEAVLAQCAPDIRHRFAGQHAFGGERHDVEMLRRWFQRVGRVLPGLRIDITDIFVKGMPWDTTAVVMWTETVGLRTGEPYVNQGVHHLQLRWGRVTSINVYLDTQRAVQVLTNLGAAGVAEAMADPIVGRSAVGQTQNVTVAYE